MDFMRKGLVLLPFLLAAIAPGHAKPIDLHAYWDDRCASCHGDAGAFARRTLSVKQGKLSGTHHKDNLDVFLHQHYVADDLVAPVSQMLIAQATSPATFKDHCAGCHQSAAAFARKSLAMRDGVLVGKTSGRPVAGYLQSHGGLAAADTPAMTATLQRVLGEVSAR